MNGFDVLSAMNANRWIEDIPVIMISAENGSTHIERAYQMGVTDFISRPFDALIVHRRVVNTIMLYAKQKKLVKIAYEICRWHHKRYDGRGYPDGLKGDEIPIKSSPLPSAPCTCWNMSG